jgi:hypothetical protein
MGRRLGEDAQDNHPGDDEEYSEHGRQIEGLAHEKPPYHHDQRRADPAQMA